MKWRERTRAGNVVEIYNQIGVDIKELIGAQQIQNVHFKPKRKTSPLKVVWRRYKIVQAKDQDY
jgi:hypothetical protein